MTISWLNKCSYKCFNHPVMDFWLFLLSHLAGDTEACYVIFQQRYTEISPAKYKRNDFCDHIYKSITAAHVILLDISVQYCHELNCYLNDFYHTEFDLMEDICILLHT